MCDCCTDEPAVVEIDMACCGKHDVCQTCRTWIHGRFTCPMCGW